VTDDMASAAEGAFDESAHLVLNGTLARRMPIF
jgi:hypothetical protein